MELKVTEGCVCDAIEINGHLIDNYTDQEKLEYLHKCLDKLDPGFYNNIFRDIAELAGTYKCLGHCDECGDSIYEYRFKFK